MNSKAKIPNATCAPLITARGVTLSYGDREVLRGVDVAIRAGDFLGLLGRNGEGKTTLLRGLLGLLPVRAGSVERFSVEGQRLRLGYVPQRERLDPIFPLSVREVVEMGAYARVGLTGRLPKEARVGAIEALELVELSDRLGVPFATLSGGQRQRVLIARALVSNPHVLLLDEPTTGIDMPTSQSIMKLLKQLNEVRRLAIVLVSHYLHDVRRSVREVLWVASGQLIRGPVEELLSAEFLGEMIA